MMTAMAVMCLVSTANAREINSGAEHPPVCAIVSDFNGTVSIMDANRTRSVAPERKMRVGCGSWISVASGSLRLKLRDGHDLTVGMDSFASLPAEEEQVQLYRGRIFADVTPGSAELRMISANARARIRNGAAVLIYNDEEEDSQLVVLEKSATLENRFAPEKKMPVKAGELSALNFKLLRVIPSAPRAVSSASLKAIFSDLNFDPNRVQKLAQNVEERHGRTPASFPVLARESAADEYGSEAGAARRKAKEEVQKSYMRHKPSELDESLKGHWVQKFVGGTPYAGKLTEKSGIAAGTKGHVSVSVSTLEGKKGRKPAHVFLKPKRSLEEEEKQKLIDELKQLE